MKFSVTVTLKKDVLDPQGKVVQNTLNNLGMKNLKNISQKDGIFIHRNSDRIGKCLKKDSIWKKWNFHSCTTWLIIQQISRETERTKPFTSSKEGFFFCAT